MDEHYSQNSDKPGSKQRFHLELSGFQALLCSLALLFSLAWMFIFGILVGRGLPLVDSKDTSYRAELLQFLGLGRELNQSVENAAETWEDPQKQAEIQKKIVESLSYYEDLSRKEASLPPPAPSEQPAAAPKEKSPDQGTKTKTKQPSTGAQRTDAPSTGSQKSTSQPPSRGQEAGESVSEHFTLLIASLKDGESARKLVDQLRAKGYNARLEPLDAGGANWNRVLLGSFPNREGALRFAAEFNRRERMEGLVIRESR